MAKEETFCRLKGHCQLVSIKWQLCSSSMVSYSKISYKKYYFESTETFIVFNFRAGLKIEVLYNLKKHHFVGLDMA